MMFGALSSDQLDLRELADDWQSDRDLRDADIEEALANERPTGFPRLRRAYVAAQIEAAYADDEQRYIELTDQLGIDPDPDALRWWANSYEPMLIADSAFEDYARELAEDIGAVPESGWPATCIDWEQAADELRMDYTSIEFDGYDYLIRA